MSLLGYYILHYLTLSSYSPLWFIYSPSHCWTESCYVGLACWWNHWNPTTTSIQSCRNSGGAHRDRAGGTGQGDRGARGEVGMGSQHVSSRKNGKHMMNTCDLQDVTTIVSKWMTRRNWVFLPYIFWTARLIAIQGCHYSQFQLRFLRIWMGQLTMGQSVGSATEHWDQDHLPDQLQEIGPPDELTGGGETWLWSLGKHVPRMGVVQRFGIIFFATNMWR